jgi:enediyne biosynthesis protein E5
MPDPRLYQIAMLASLLVYGMGWLAFDITVARACLLLATALGTQAICDRVMRRADCGLRNCGLPVDDQVQQSPIPNPQSIRNPQSALGNWRSALISGLSLCLLLRTNRHDLAVAAAVIAIGAKFVLRWRGKHLFNPTNGGIVAMLLVSDGVWVSPGQWGAVAFFAFLMACLGGVVVNRASRSDVTYAFIVVYCALLVGRSVYLGEPMAIPLHRLESGALLLFTFFMISDPKTTPDSRAGRVLFAALVAAGGWYVQFRLFRTNGLLWSLAACSLAVPLIDWLLPGAQYSWTIHKEQRHETTLLRRRAGSDGRLVWPVTAWLLRLLRRQGGYETVQQSVAGRARS